MNNNNNNSTLWGNRACQRCLYRVIIFCALVNFNLNNNIVDGKIRSKPENQIYIKLFEIYSVYFWNLSEIDL